MSMTKDEQLEEAFNSTPPEMVHEFHKAFGHPVNRTPAMPTKEEMILRVNLIQEEVNELKEAVATEDYVEMADAIFDSLYVVLGGIEVLGLGNPVGDLVLASIHVSNMSKQCSSVEVAHKFIDETCGEFGPIYYYEKNEDNTATLYHAVGDKKGKIAKSPEYHKPDLSFLLQHIKK